MHTHGKLSIGLGFLVVIAGMLCNPTAAEQYPALPPAGIEVPQAKLNELQRRLNKLELQLQQSELGETDRVHVEVFARAAALALEQGLFYQPKDIDRALRAIQIGEQRLQSAKRGVAGKSLLAIGGPQATRSRLLAGGFRSAIDLSVQPFGIVLPEQPLPQDGSKLRLDVWLHGRGDTATEIPFLLERLEKVGQYSPPGVIVLHPFGRHCNAFKFAGERDVYESIEAACSLFPIDRSRISIRGFSMGGAGTWHLAAHDPGNWFAANPGAGFVDTVKYQGWGDRWPYPKTPWAVQLMKWYDMPLWVDNLANTRVIAYSGELDGQRKSAEIMIDAVKQSSVLQSLGYQVPHVIGAKMGHKIDDPSAQRIDKQLAQWEPDAGKVKQQVRLTTYSLRYHQVDWISIDGMVEHWQPATLAAQLQDNLTIDVKTAGLTAFTIQFDEAKGGWPQRSGYLKLNIDGEPFDGPTVFQGKPMKTSWFKRDGQWTDEPEVAPEDTLAKLSKRPGLQGPIDDAFMSSFLFVVPSRPCRHGVVQRFVDRELEFARKRWRQIMRGDDRVVLDKDLTAEQIQNNNLICFGDFQSNRYLAAIASALPFQWTDKQLQVGQDRFDPATHAVSMIYPNPQAPERYVVVNSGITFREFSNKTNSRQIAMLPDWSILDVTNPSDGIYPGVVKAAGFFDEQWQLKLPQKSANTTP